MRRTIGWVHPLAACVLVAAVAVAVGSCVSERAPTAVTTSVCDVRLPPEALGSTIVSVRDFEFTPTQVSIQAGTKVTWVNCGGSSSNSHTSTSDSGVWDSGLLAPGASFTRQFDTPGAFPFHCAPHPFMKGTITVN